MESGGKTKFVFMNFLAFNSIGFLKGRLIENHLLSLFMVSGMTTSCSATLSPMKSSGFVCGNLLTHTTDCTGV